MFHELESKGCIPYLKLGISRLLEIHTNYIHITFLAIHVPHLPSSLHCLHPPPSIPFTHQQLLATLKIIRDTIIEKSTLFQIPKARRRDGPIQMRHRSRRTRDGRPSTILLDRLDSVRVLSQLQHRNGWVGVTCADEAAPEIQHFLQGIDVRGVADGAQRAEEEGNVGGVRLEVGRGWVAVGVAGLYDAHVVDTKRIVGVFSESAVGVVGIGGGEGTAGEAGVDGCLVDAAESEVGCDTLGDVQCVVCNVA